MIHEGSPWIVKGSPGAKARRGNKTANINVKASLPGHNGVTVISNGARLTVAQRPREGMQTWPCFFSHLGFGFQSLPPIQHGSL